MKNGVEKGAFILFLSGLICKIFGALFRLPLTSIVGIEGIGIYQMVLSLYSFLLAIVTGSVSVVLSQSVSAYRARGSLPEIKKLFRCALKVTLSVSFILGLIVLVFSNAISSFQGAPQTAISYPLIFLLLPFGAFIGCFRGMIQGYENMTPTAISQIIEQIVKFCLGLTFANFFIKFGTGAGVFGGFLGITVSELAAVIYLSFATKKNVPLKKVNLSQKSMLGSFLASIIPLGLGNAIIPFTHCFESMVIVGRLKRAGIAMEEAHILYGLQTGVVGAILNFPLIISLAITTALLPKISFLSQKSDKKLQKNVISKAFVAMWSVLLPIVLGIMAISQNFYPVIYRSIRGALMPHAIMLTTIGGVSIILTAIMQFLLSIMHAKGKYVYCLIALSIGGAARIAIIYFMSSLSTMSIYALPLGTIALNIIVSLLLLIYLKDLVKVPFFDFFTVLFSSFIMYILVKIIVSLNLGNILTIAISVLVGGICYVILAFPILKDVLFSLISKK